MMERKERGRRRKERGREKEEAEREKGEPATFAEIEGRISLCPNIYTAIFMSVFTYAIISAHQAGRLTMLLKEWIPTG